MGCLHRHCFRLVAIAWVRMECCSNIGVSVLLTVVYFKDRNSISKTVNCICCWWSVKWFFAPNFPIFRITLAKSQEEQDGEEGEEEAVNGKALCVSRKRNKWLQTVSEEIYLGGSSKSSKSHVKRVQVPFVVKCHRAASMKSIECTVFVNL